jgi:hypothetical protein
MFRSTEMSQRTEAREQSRSNKGRQDKDKDRAKCSDKNVDKSRGEGREVPSIYSNKMNK